jgi:hypothetical protein
MRVIYLHILGAFTGVCILSKGGGSNEGDDEDVEYDLHVKYWFVLPGTFTFYILTFTF